MKEINEIVNNHIQNMQSEGLIQKAIEEGVQKAVMKAIDDQFNSWGGITKQLDEIFKQSLKVDHKKIDIPSYNMVMCQAIQKKINEHFKEGAAAKMIAKLDGLFQPMPAEMTTHDFVSAICETWKSDDPCGCNDDIDEYATVELTHNDGALSGSYNLKIWKKKKEESYLSSYSSRERKEDIHLYISEEGEIRISHGFNPTCLGDEDEVIVKAYAAGTKLVDIADYNPDDYEYELRGEYY